jgi:outer membrane lipopolysaccharide assembly protein LptE/RlpB
MKRSQIAIIVLLLAALLLTACGASQQFDNSAPGAIEKSAYQAESPAAESPSGASTSAGQTRTDQLQETRKIIYHADMSLVVDDTEQSVKEIVRLAESAGGYVASMNGYRQDDSMLYDITIRVPAEQFEPGLASLRKMAVRVERESLGTDDVTDQYYDLEARLRTLEATEKELTQLLEETRERGGDVDDIMKIYDHLTQIRSDIESLQGQLNRLEKLIAFSTISIHLEPYILSKPIESQGWRPAEIIHSSFVSLVNVLTGLATFLIQFVIVVLPVLVILFLPLILVIWLIHRWQKRRQLEKGKDTAE